MNRDKCVDLQEVPCSGSWVSGLDSRNRTFRTIVACVAFLLVTGAIANRVYKKYQMPGRFTEVNQGFCDFHNGIYFPASAFVQRVNPYGADYTSSYPVERSIPAYLPSVLLLHSPLTLLPLNVAEVVYYLLMMAMIVAISWLSLRTAGWPRPTWIILSVATFIAASRSGYATLFTGYFTFELVLGLLLAVFCGHRTLPGSMGYALAAIKPTTAIPLTIMMIARGQWRAVAGGMVTGAVGSAIALGWLFTNTTPGDFFRDVQATQQIHRDDPNELPLNTWTRVDLLAVLAKWTDWRPGDLEHVLVMLPLIAWPAWLVFQRRDEPPVPETWQTGGTKSEQWLRGAGLTEAVVILSVTVTIYHHHYDLIALVPVALSALAGTRGWIRYRGLSWVVGVSIALVLMNYSGSRMILDRLNGGKLAEMIITSINGCLLATVWLCCCYTLGRKSPIQAPEKPV